MKPKHLLWVACTVPSLWAAGAQATPIDPPTLSHDHGYCEAPFDLTLTAPADAAIYYTLDCSTPTSTHGVRYTGPIAIQGTTIVRALAVPLTSGGDAEPSVTVTASYLFADDVLRQNNTPQGYPAQWGPYSSISGTAIADYEMDPEMTSQPDLAQLIRQGLYTLPVVSLVTDRDNLFSHTKNDSTGGIYIYTGGDASSTGNGYGDGWVRPASIEYIPTQQLDTGALHTGCDYTLLHKNPEGFQVNCAIKMHGNASRMAEKTPKHSIRMQMKSAYGPGKLKYRLFGTGSVKRYDQIVLRAGFGNSWLHWTTGQQRQAMFTRDAWAKRMMSHLGYLSSGTRFAHLYLNGLYWGVYNPTERIDEDFCEAHLGGLADDYDVVRFDDGALNTVAGTLDAYLTFLGCVNNSATYTLYQRMQGLSVAGDSLPDAPVYFDVDNFIDFMLLNYYGGNGDWDHHNWVAVRDRTARRGFQWLPWDSELVLQGVNDNILKVNNAQCPTWVFHTLMSKCPAFKQRFVDRVHRHCEEAFGAFSPDSAAALWEALTAEVSAAVYAESARWGDYRRDVHPYTSRGSLYTHDDFDRQCTSMRTGYFPQRASILVGQLQNAGLWSAVAAAPVMRADGVEVTQLADTLAPRTMVSLKGSSQVYYTTDGSDPLGWSTGGYPKRNASATLYSGAFPMTTSGVIKARCYYSGKGWSPLCERHLIVAEETGIENVERDATSLPDAPCYDLMGRRVDENYRGLVICNGKVMKRE